MGEPQPVRVRFDAFELDEADARLTYEGRPIELAPRPFAVLCALARAPRTLVTKNALLDAVWGHRYVSDSALKTTVSALRAALDDDARTPRYIETVSRRGYRWIAESGAQDDAVGSLLCGGKGNDLLIGAGPSHQCMDAGPDQAPAGGANDCLYAFTAAGRPTPNSSDVGTVRNCANPNIAANGEPCGCDR